jgi:predicted ArsR family transcriptional regulator
MILGWLEELEREVVACLSAPGGLSARELADRLGISERSAVGYITMLAMAGRLVIERVTLPVGEHDEATPRSTAASPRTPAE